MSSHETRERDILNCFTIENVDHGYAAVRSRIQYRRSLLDQHGRMPLPSLRDEEETPEEEDDEEFQINFTQSKVEKFDVPQIPSRSELFKQDQENLKKQYLKDTSNQYTHLILKDQYDGRNIADSNFTLEYIVCKDAADILAQVNNIVQQNFEKRIWILNDHFFDLTKVIDGLNLQVNFTSLKSLPETSKNGIYFCDVEDIRQVRNSLTLPHVIINMTCLLDRVEFINRFLMYRLEGEEDSIHPKFINLGISSVIDLLKEHIPN